MRLTSPELLSTELIFSIEELLDVVLTENGLCDRFAEAAPGDAIVYHIGLLARDRDKVATSLAADERDELETIARRAWQMAEAGLAHLLQRRVADERFAYLLIVRPRSRGHRGMATPLPVATQRAA